MDNLSVLISQYITTSNAFGMLLFSFLGGLVASVLPCNLAMLPLITGYVIGNSENKTSKIFTQMVFFVLGMSIVFSIIGLICAVTGQVFSIFAGEYFTLIIASLILVIGLKLANILDFEFPVLVNKIPKSKGSSLVVYPLLLGILFAFAGSPCSTPVLAAIMAFSALAENMKLSVLMLFLFALGQGIILIFTAIFASQIKKLNRLSIISEIVVKIGGWILIISSIWLYSKVFTRFFM